MKRWGRVEAVEFLLTCGANLFVENQQGLTAMHFGVELLAKAETPQERTTASQLIYLIEEWDVEKRLKTDNPHLEKLSSSRVLTDPSLTTLRGTNPDRRYSYNVLQRFWRSPTFRGKIDNSKKRPVLSKTTSCK